MMFWIVIGLTALSILMAKLGAMSVWVKVLGVALMVSGALLLVGLGVMAWQRLRRRPRDAQSGLPERLDRR
jgi:membrane protein implicated in regulation of membrane protease activity